MNFPQIPDWLSPVLGLMSLTLIIYNYFKNRKKKVEVDPEYIEYSTAMGLGSIALVIVSMGFIVFIYSQDKEAMKQAINNMTWIDFIILAMGYSFIEYKFRKKKKRLAAQSEIENQDSN